MNPPIMTMLAKDAVARMEEALRAGATFDGARRSPRRRGRHVTARGASGGAASPVARPPRDLPWVPVPVGEVARSPSP